LNQGGLAPKIVDPTTPGLSLELPRIHRILIEVFRRGQGATWTLLPFTTGRVDLESVEAALEFADVYADPLP
jgi:hypothetical protein